MPEINTLVPDIYNLVQKKDGWFDGQLSQSLVTETSAKLSEHFTPKERKGSLRLSKMGDYCPKALWYSVHHPELAEPLPPWAIIKLSYGHILEALVLSLVRAAGHRVEGEQDELVVDGIKGHRDAVIDGCVCDVKSCSSRMFQRFKDKSIATHDDFGYLAQLDGYLCGSAEDPLVLNKDKAYIIAIDRTLGHIVSYEHQKREQFILERISRYKRIVEADICPACECRTVKSGESGNIALGFPATYSPYKFCCFPQLRTFLYSKGVEAGPVYLTKVVRLPNVPEIDRHGRLVH